MQIKRAVQARQLRSCAKGCAEARDGDSTVSRIWRAWPVADRTRRTGRKLNLRGGIHITRLRPSPAGERAAQRVHQPCELALGALGIGEVQRYEEAEPSR